MSAVYGTVPNPIWAWDTGKISDNAFFSGNCGFPFEFRSAHLANSTEYIFLKLGLSSISYSVVWIDINYLLLCNSKLSTSEEHVFIISHIFWLSTIWERLSWVILARFLLRLQSNCQVGLESYPGSNGAGQSLLRSLIWLLTDFHPHWLLARYLLDTWVPP